MKFHLKGLAVDSFPHLFSALFPASNNDLSNSKYKQENIVIFVLETAYSGTTPPLKLISCAQLTLV